MLDTRSDPGTRGQLSVSMIVRDEARRLPGCIAALAPFADEIIVVDTGSSDDTVAIARALGCTVDHFPWCDDFAAARNAALLPCRYPWILSIDADEQIAPEDHDALRALLRESPDRAYRFVTRNYTGEASVSGFEPLTDGAPHARGFAGWFPSTKVRLFPNLETIRFEGMVHELPNNSLLRSGVAIVDTPIPIHHYPLLNAREGALEAKRHMYLALGKKKIAEHPKDARAHSELGDQYIDMGDIAAAVVAYKTAVALEPEAGCWLKNLGAALYLLGHYPQALQALRLAVTRDPDLEEGWRNLGVVLLRDGSWAEAREALTRALQLNDRQPDTYRYLAIAEHHDGHTSRALSTLERMLARFPDHGEGRALYTALLDGGPGAGQGA